MKHLISLVIVLTIGSAANAQTDTVYFDKDWHVTTIKSDMAYYRIPAVKKNDRWLVVDYYGNGVKQMEGYYLVEDPSTLIYAETNDNSGKDGPFKFYSENGMVNEEGVYKDGHHVGVWKYYYDSTNKIKKLETNEEDGSAYYAKYYHRNGQLKSEGKITRETENEYYNQGLWKYYDSTGNLKEECKYRDDELHGDFKTYYPTGELKRHDIYFEGISEGGKCYNKQGSVIPYTPYVVPPTPEYNVIDYISKNTKYPKSCVKEDIEGIINVKFKVAEDGSITEVKSISTDEDNRLQEEAMRVINSLPAFKPGLLDGEPYSRYYTVPVIFKLNEKQQKDEQN